MKAPSELTAGDDARGVWPAEAMRGVSAGDTPCGVLYGELQGDTAGLLRWYGSMAKPCACGCFMGCCGKAMAAAAGSAVDARPAAVAGIGSAEAAFAGCPV